MAFEEKSTTVKSATLFDGKNTIDKQRVSLGAKSQSVGQSGLNTESSGTNAIKALEIMKDIIQSLPK